MITPEVQNYLGDIVSLLPLLGMAFTSSVRAKIISRDRHCVRCGATTHLEAAHLNHDKSSPRYNDPENGVVLDTKCHLQDHIEREGMNGLSIEGNQWAIQALLRKLAEYDPRG